MVPDQRPPPPLDPPMVPFVLAGLALWAVAGLVLLLVDAPADWRWTCLAGFILGLPGLAVMIMHDRRRPARPPR
jgi:hypothetical protein